MLLVFGGKLVPMGYIRFITLVTLCLLVPVTFSLYYFSSNGGDWSCPAKHTLDTKGEVDIVAEVEELWEVVMPIPEGLERLIVHKCKRWKGQWFGKQV